MDALLQRSKDSEAIAVKDLERINQTYDQEIRVLAETYGERIAYIQALPLI